MAIVSGYGGGSLASMGDSSRFFGQTYPSPYATQGKTWTPTHTKHLFETCKYYYLTHPLINAALTKQAVYPITELIIDDQNSKLREFWADFLQEDMLFFNHLIEAGLDYNVFGNMIATVMFPFIKYLSCKQCRTSIPAKQASFEFYDGTFRHRCKKCGHNGASIVTDYSVKSKSGIRVVRWSPADFVIDYNEATGRCLYQWRVPPKLKHDVLAGKKHVITEVPQEFIDAIKDNKPIIFNNERLFHMKRPTISSTVLGKALGAPMILPVLEDVLYLQILRKAQEMIASEHLVPLRILFPQGTSGGDQPYSTINLSKWKDQIQEELMRFRSDRNYIPVLPVPVGNQTISGDGRALLLHQEIRVVSEQVIAGMGVPIEFVMGGLSYSGSSVSMRMLENSMLNYRNEHIRYANWVVRQIAQHMRWPLVKVSLRDFKMADDLNRRQYLFNLWQAGAMSLQDLLEESSLDAAEQAEKRKGEEAARFSEQERTLIAQTEAQIKAQRLQMLAQSDLEKEIQQRHQEDMAKQMPSTGAAELQQYGSQLNTSSMAPAERGSAGTMNLSSHAQQLASRLLSIDPMSRASELARIHSQSSALAAEVRKIIKENTLAQKQTATSLPEQRPPRREAGSALI